MSLDIISQNYLQGNEPFFSKWRPAMAYMYLGVCIFDFILAPIGWPILQSLNHITLTEWIPVSLNGGAIFHLAMGAIIGVSSYGRTMERIQSQTILATADPKFSFPEPQKPVLPSDSK